MGLDVLEFLHDSSWPANFDELRSRIFAQPRNQPLIAGGKITDPGVHRKILSESRSRNDFHTSSDPVVVGLGADSLNRDPVLTIAAVIPQYVSLLACVADYNIRVAVIVDVAERSASASPTFLKNIDNDGDTDIVVSNA